MVQIPSITSVNFFRGFGIYTAGPFAARLLHPAIKTPRITHDILDRSGECLLRAASSFDRTAFSLLQHHHLKHPFDICIALQDPITPVELEWDFLHLAQEYSLISGAIDWAEIESLVRGWVGQLLERPLLQQKLTVMKLAEPAIYTRTLLTAGLALALCKTMRLPNLDAERAFVGSLYHLCGMLHLDARLLGSSDDLTAAESLQLHTHLRIIQALMALEGASTPELLAIVADSHERCDGTGYPAGKVESEIAYEAQILGLASAVADIYLQRIKPQGRGWREVIGIISLSRQAYLFRALEALNTLLAKSQLPPNNVVSGVDYFGFKTEVIARSFRLEEWFEGLRLHLLGIGFVHGDRHLHALQNSVFQIAIAYKVLLDSHKPSAAGELTEADVPAIVDLSDPTHLSLEQRHLMTQELEQHLRKLSQLLERYLLERSPVNVTIKSALERALAHALQFVQG